MKNSEYWINRQEAKYINAEREVGKFYNDLIKAFKRAKKNIHSVINNFYIRYADNNELTYDVAMQELNFKELQELKDQLKEFRELAIDSIGEFNLELENMSMKARITRYQALEMQIDGILSNLYSIDYEAYGIEEFINIYKDQYYKTIFNIEQYKGFHSEFAQINIRAVEELINYPFSGASYSDRLWRQKEDLIFKLKDSIMNMIIRGTNPQDLAEDFAKHFGTKYHEAYRLLQMEGAFIVEQATLKGYEEDDIEKYEILATLDLKTSDICREQDGKVYNVKDAVTGVNSPPFHWFCRTTTIPHYEDATLGQRIARNPETDKSYMVPEDMKYPEWYAKYVANNPKALIEEKKLKNRYSDKKQYKKYKEVLGEDSPKTFAEFQEVKYNDIDEWDFINDYVKSRRSNMISVFSPYRDFKKYKNIIESEIIGITTSNGVEIKSQSKHFIERVLGTSLDPEKQRPRDGVEIEEIYKTLTQPLKVKEEPIKNSHKFIGENITVTINPDTGNLIQCNPTEERLVRRLKNV